MCGHAYMCTGIWPVCYCMNGADLRSAVYVCTYVRTYVYGGLGTGYSCAVVPDGVGLCGMAVCCMYVRRWGLWQCTYVCMLIQMHIHNITLAVKPPFGQDPCQFVICTLIRVCLNASQICMCQYKCPFYWTQSMVHSLWLLFCTVPSAWQSGMYVYFMHSSIDLCVQCVQERRRELWRGEGSAGEEEFTDYGQSECSMGWCK